MVCGHAIAILFTLYSWPLKKWYWSKFMLYLDRNIHHLLEDLQDILETPSKKTLWFYIIPLLSSSHQRYAQTQLHLPQHVVRSGNKININMNDLIELLSYLILSSFKWGVRYICAKRWREIVLHQSLSNTP